MRFGQAIGVIGAGAILLLGLGGCAGNTTKSPDLPQPRAGTVRFMVEAPGAKQVSIVGSFNGWTKDSIQLTPIKGTSWWLVD
ncbi:MAG: hypothetical protein NZM29_02655, partial [Nitrospira sp.]|nr:hypothetical protein [Nitrospira sp.]